MLALKPDIFNRILFGRVWRKANAGDFSLRFRKFTIDLF
jgi:hypothetical protein